MGLLRRIAGKLTKNSKLTFYKTIVGPHLDYCATVLFLLTDTQIDELQKIQNKVMRVLLKAKRETHIKDMLEELDILSVDQRIQSNVLKFLFKVENSLCPKYPSEKLVKRNQLTNYSIRSGDTFSLPQFKSKLTKFKKFNPNNVSMKVLIPKSKLYVKNQ